MSSSREPWSPTALRNGPPTSDADERGTAAPRDRQLWVSALMGRPATDEQFAWFVSLDALFWHDSAFAPCVGK